jgi:ABC-2 type transport system permease protein
MNSFQRIMVITNYEWKRALAKRKILALVIFAIVIQVLPFVIFTQLSAAFLTEEAKATMWVFGALGGQSLFIQLVAIIIAGGAMAEEYEHGTADILLSKPIRRLEYLFGKFVGGLLLLIAVEAIMVATGVVMALAIFGSQTNLQFVPVIFAAIAYSSLLLFSLTFMFSEVTRRGTLAILASIGVFITSQVVYTVLSVLYLFSQASGQPVQLYLDVGKILPTWSSGSLPTFIASQLMPMLENNPLITSGTGDVVLAVVVIAAYMIVSIVLAATRLLKSDITKKID